MGRRNIFKKKLIEKYFFIFHWRRMRKEKRREKIFKYETSLLAFSIKLKEFSQLHQERFRLDVRKKNLHWKAGQS